MTEQITIEEALEIVSFERDSSGKWEVYYVKGTVFGNVLGDVRGNILGTVFGTVLGDVGGNVGGNVGGTVKGKIHSDEWKRNLLEDNQ